MADSIPTTASVEVACALIDGGEGRFLACRRAAHVRDAGAWEFPGGKVEEGESPAECVARELREELGVVASVAAPVAAVTAVVSGRFLTLHACPAVLREEPRGSTDHDRFAYLSLDEFLRMPITSAERSLLELLAARTVGLPD